MPYNSLDLVYNPIRLTIPFPTGYIAPEKLRYLAELYIPDAPDSTTFIKLADLETTHRPAKNGVYKDAELYIEDFLKRQFTNPVPDGTETAAADRLVRISGAVLPYYIRYKRDPLDADWTQLQTRYALEAGLGFEEFAGNVFVTDVLQATKMFLTWQPVTKTVQIDQPEYLDFLTNFSGLTTLHLKVKSFQANGTSTTETKATVGGIQVNSIYRCAVGFTQLGLDASVTRYEVWLENQIGTTVSEVRSFQLDSRYRRNQKYILFQNGMGGFDTLCFTGRSQKTLSVTSSLVQRFLSEDYAVRDGEFEISEVSGESTIEISTGFVSQKYFAYFQDFFLSERIYLLGAKGPVPYSIQTKDLLYDIDDETLFGTKVKLKAAYTVNRYSTIPTITFTATQTYTATCPANQTGASVTKSATQTSLISQADADQKALAKAQALAESELVCSFKPEGTYIREDCKPNTTERWTIVADGNGGEKYGQLLDAQSTLCGYIPSLSFNITDSTVAGKVTIDNLIGGDPNQNFEWSFNNRTWTALPGAGGYGNPQVLNLPISGALVIYVRRGSASKSISTILPDGYVSGSNGIRLTCQQPGVNPFIQPNQIAITVLPMSGTALPALPYYVHYKVMRKVDNNVFHNVLMGQDVMLVNDQGYNYNVVTLDILTPGTTYVLSLLAGPTGWNTQSFSFTT
ncbi:DUF5977 domain-containing protein [Xanthocytophaga flava]|uniref:DUF5977 domain-containing protein n=1 Tax=Xanthocytophaga flava TaxID=3048013 RepID=UPI0028D216F0|nr:hypothetical protein [Xanthocytophaga flavus]MDJ1468154.1 hypothetical protein [Xanthocytophaga flavus]